MTYKAFKDQPTKSSPLYSKSNHKTGKYPQTAPWDWNCCFRHLVHDGGARDAARESGEKEGEWDKTEVESLDNEEKDEDAEVEDLDKVELKCL